MKIEITLPKNRLTLGKIRLIDGVATLHEGPALGLADGLAAAKSGNPDRAPLKPYGDTPTGKYNGWWQPLPLTPENRGTYGDYPILTLQPVSGDALKTRGIRTGIAIHSGRLNPAYTQWATLRPTHGCVRISPATHKALYEALGKLGSVEVNIIEV